MALAMFTNLAAGALGGILLPLALDRLTSTRPSPPAPFVTTVTDVVGYGSFLGIATLWFRLG